MREVTTCTCAQQHIICDAVFSLHSCVLFPTALRCTYISNTERERGNTLIWRHFGVLKRHFEITDRSNTTGTPGSQICSSNCTLGEQYVLSFVNSRNFVTYWLLTPRSGVLEKLTGSQLVKKFPTFYGTLRLITALTSARHLSLSWATSIQSKPHNPLPEDPS